MTPIKRDLLKPRPASSVREATRPPEAGKILCNFLLPADESISYIVTNSNTNNQHTHLKTILIEGKHNQKVGGLWHRGTDILSQFWNFTWQLEINMQINQIMGALISEMLKMDGLRDYNNKHLLTSYMSRSLKISLLVICTLYLHFLYNHSHPQCVHLINFTNTLSEHFSRYLMIAKGTKWDIPTLIFITHPTQNYLLE